MAIDPKPASYQFLRAHMPDTEKHMFHCMKEVTNGIKTQEECWCKWHSQFCLPHSKSKPKTPLVMICGFPCSPYSSQRGDRHLRG